MTKIIKIKDFWSKKGILQKCTKLFRFFGHNFWSTEPIFIIQKQKCSKLQGLSNDTNFIYILNRQRLGHFGCLPGIRNRRSEHPRHPCFLKWTIFLKTREKMLYNLKISHKNLKWNLFIFLVEISAKHSW